MCFLNNKKPKINFEKDEFSIVDLMSYMIYHSYVKYSREAFIKGISQIVEEEYIINLSINGYINTHIDDFIPVSQQSIILNAILPEYQADDFAFYIEDSEDADYGIDAMLSDLKLFFEQCKVPKKHRQTKDIKEFVSDCQGQVEVVATVVVSDYLKKIHQNKDLKHLLESALNVMFTKSNQIMFIDAYRADSSDGLEYSIINQQYEFRNLIECLKTKFKKKRMTKQNKELAAIIQQMDVVEDISYSLKNTFSTETEVMF